MGIKRSPLVTDEELKRVEEITGYKFSDIELARVALSHKAVMEQTDELTLRNQRLEFLGDSILSYLVSCFLYEYYPYRDEGFLSKIRSKVVDNRNLSIVGERIGLKEVASAIRKRRGGKGSGRHSRKVLGDIFESVVGAIYLDGGLEKAGHFVAASLLKDIEEVERIEVDYKTYLQEWCQKRSLSLPSYVVLYSVGPEHDKSYTISVRVENLGRAIGVGKSKKDAEQSAAKKICEITRTKEMEEE